MGRLSRINFTLAVRRKEAILEIVKHQHRRGAQAENGWNAARVG
jgi:hypothetical protein